MASSSFMPVQLSATGRVSLGASFVDIYGRRPPARLEAVGALALGSTSTSLPLVSWSAFSGARKGHSSASGIHKAADHVAVAFGRSALSLAGSAFFHVGVFRCDTWALQWAVRLNSKSEAGQVADVVCLSAYTVVFLVKFGDNKKKTHEKLYVASKLDLQHDELGTSNKWRPFLTEAYNVDTGFPSENICSIQPFSPSSFLLLTTAGRLVRVTVTNSPKVVTRSEEVATLEPVEYNSANKSVALSLVSSTAVTSGDCVTAVDQESETRPAFAVVYAAGGSAYHVLDLKNPKLNKWQTITVPKKTTIKRVEFAGPYMIVATLSHGKSDSFALQFTCVAPSGPSAEPSFECSSFELVKMPLHRVPLATIFDEEREVHTILVQYNHRVASAGASHDSEPYQRRWWSLLEYAELPVHEGPYTTDTLQKATWWPVPEPYRVPAAAATAVGGSAAVDEHGDTTTSDFQHDLAQLSQSQSSGYWEPICLHYPVAHAEIKDGGGSREVEDVSVCVIAVETAPFAHTRLSKQWPNGTQGLWHLLVQSDDNNGLTVRGLSPFAVSWNPRHVNRALLLLSQERFCFLFSKAAAFLRDSTTPEKIPELLYGTAASAVVDMALQMITLTRRVGACLRQEDVELVVRLLRASRSTGHMIVKHITRGHLLLESTVRRRMADRVLAGFHERGNVVTADAGQEGDAGETTEADMFHNVPSEMRIERTLHCKYAPNVWTQRLIEKSPKHAEVVSGAIQYLSQVSPLLEQLRSRQRCQGDLEECKGPYGNEEEGRQEEGKMGRKHKGARASRPPTAQSDWLALGCRPHVDTNFTDYEFSLMRTGNAF
ncbi:hypothetical protein ERJ75_000272000 [Trypanosoma vivax]|nr:hypothetical protein TRVL_06760 [Trypanosoma vivax]KAH8618400.1 hypothetical protein ERJ75_000272000 [Trypanosoma vivax]